MQSLMKDNIKNKVLDLLRSYSAALPVPLYVNRQGGTVNKTRGQNLLSLKRLKWLPQDHIEKLQV